MLILILATILCLVISLAVDREKTYLGCQRGIGLFLDIMPTLLLVLALVSVFIYLIPEETMTALLGAKSGPFGVLIAALIGSIALIPPFVSFPLAQIFLARGIPYTTVAVFITTLMMVGFLTLPLEFRFFGKKAALMRNGLSFLGAIVIGLLMGLFL